MKSKKVVLLANTDWYLANFRFELAASLRERGADVHCIAPSGRYLPRLEQQGFQVHALEMGNESFSPLDNYRTLKHLKSLYRQIQPDIAHHFTPRCVVLGSMAARKAGVKHVINALTGLGHVFTSHSVKSRLARPVLRAILKKNLNGDDRAVIFQNSDDMNELVAAGVANPDCCHLIRGSGVNTNKFRPSTAVREDREIRILFASRLIAEKGINELVGAMQDVAKAYPQAVLWIAGEPYAQNPTSLTGQDLERLKKLPYVKLLGHLDDMAELLSQVDIVALPSYREGTPKILLEAASCGLPIVATDIAGCRGLVEHGVNGYLVPLRDSVRLAESIGVLCGDAALRGKMGLRGREIIETGFSSEIVIRNTLKAYDRLLGAHPS